MDGGHVDCEVQQLSLLEDCLMRVQRAAGRITGGQLGAVYKREMPFDTEEIVLGPLPYRFLPIGHC